MPAVDHSFLSAPVDFRAALTDLCPAHWPPNDDDLQALAKRCIDLIAGIDAWETATSGRDVVDSRLGKITTADARRLLVRELSLSEEGETAVLLIPAETNCVRGEMRADVDECQGMLRRPELVLGWEDEDGERNHYVPLKNKGPHWYMLSQLRDDLNEDRLVSL